MIDRLAFARRVLAGAVAFCIVSAALASETLAQGQLLQRCQQQILTGTLEREFAPSGELVSYFRQGMNLNCPVERRSLRADSAHHYPDQQRLELFGNVTYTESEAVINSDHMTYYMSSDHVEATGNVRAQLAKGSTMRGPSARYYARNPQLRPAELLEATGRPSFALVDGTDTTVVDANRVFMNGDEVFASGDVRITRKDMRATSDSMYANSAPQQRLLRLMRDPVMTGTGDKEFTMRGELINIEANADREITRVLSLSGANILSEELRLVADTIDLRIEQNLMSRAFAFGDSGAVMHSGTYTLHGDSLDIQMPGQRPSAIRASGNALAEITPDSTRIISEDNDFMKGDTIIVTFEQVYRSRRPPASGDSAVRNVLTAPPPDSITMIRDTVDVPRTMLATGKASLFFQRAVQGMPSNCPAIHYASGATISVSLSDGEIRGLNVARGSDALAPAMGVNSECIASRATGRPGGGR